MTPDDLQWWERLMSDLYWYWLTCRGRLSWHRFAENGYLCEVDGRVSIVLWKDSLRVNVCGAGGEEVNDSAWKGRDNPLREFRRNVLDVIDRCQKIRRRNVLATLLVQLALMQLEDL